MKLLTFKEKAKEVPYQMGVLINHKVVPLKSVMETVNPELSKRFLSNAEEFYRNLPEDLTPLKKAVADYQGSEGFSIESVQLGPVVTRPEKIICVGTNYRDHVLEMGHEMPDFPVLFAKFSNTLIGHGESIERRKKTDKLDYEVELTAVIGKTCREVSEGTALDYVLGYTIGNDTSARDLQKRTLQWLQGKTLDRTTPIGPYLVTTDELPDPGNLTIKSYVNGEKRQSSHTSQLIFNLPHLISFISNIMTLEPGDVILTGTPHGVGAAMDPPGYLNAGDLVTMEIEGIGMLENTVTDD